MNINLRIPLHADLSFFVGKNMISMIFYYIRLRNMTAAHSATVAG